MGDRTCRPNTVAIVSTLAFPRRVSMANQNFPLTASRNAKRTRFGDALTVRGTILCPPDCELPHRDPQFICSSASSICPRQYSAL